MRVFGKLAMSRLAFGQAATAEDIGAAVKSCRAEPDDSRRLACYDRAVDGARPTAPTAATPAPKSEAPKPPRRPPRLRPPRPLQLTTSSAASEIDRALPATAVLTPEEKFGRTGTMTREDTDRKEQETRALGELQASVTEISTRADGLMVVTLDNGQVWRQSRPESFFRLNTGDKVTIQPASMNSFLMTAPSKRSTRVTRLK